MSIRHLLPFLALVYFIFIPYFLYADGKLFFVPGEGCGAKNELRISSLKPGEIFECSYVGDEEAVKNFLASRISMF